MILEMPGRKQKISCHRAELALDRAVERVARVSRVYDEAEHFVEFADKSAISAKAEGLGYHASDAARAASNLESVARRADEAAEALMAAAAAAQRAADAARAAADRAKRLETLRYKMGF